MLRLFRHPFGGYAVLIITFLSFCLLGIPILSIGYSGGEQVSLIIMGHGITGLVFGLIFWSMLSPIIFWSWYKDRMFIPLIVPAITAGLLICMLIEMYLSNDYYLAI